LYGYPLSSLAAFMNLSVAASHDSLCSRSSVIGDGSSESASIVNFTNSDSSLYMRQLGNCLKNSFEGWFAQITILPIARASAVVVQTTSVVLGLRNSLYLDKEKKSLLCQFYSRRNKQSFRSENVQFCKLSLVFC
jgi:hypothetical protein